MSPARTESAKGAAVHSTLEFVREEFGDVVLARALAALEPATREVIAAVSPTGEMPYAQLVALWEALDAVLRETAPSWIERAGAMSIQSRGAQLYGGILRKSSPTEFLTQSVSLFKLFYQPGDMIVVEEELGRAVLRLVGFGARTTLFCRRQTGGLTRALELAGGDHAAARHVRCACEGDAFCEWELTWQAAPPDKRESPARGIKLQV